jgi:carbamoyl-phosphate synthase large subunit
VEKKTILVTGIGGNVGQGIIRNILATGYPVKIVGTNTSFRSAGNHWVDQFYQVPFGYDDFYIPTLKRVVEMESVDLIIPSTDYESYFLSLHRKALPCKLAASGEESTGIYLDKYITWERHFALNIPFAESCLPSLYTGQYSRAIAKPRKGRGSKGLIKDIQTTEGLEDNEYLIQELHEGLEITTAAYVRYTDGELHGLVTMERSLDNGATTYCQVVMDYDDQLRSIALSMSKNFDLAGSFNIQSIVTKEGKVIPFEVNCRISGTNSIRSSFGFTDVKYTVGELLWNIQPEPLHIKKGVAYRFLSDVIYLEPGLDSLGSNQDSFIEF